MKAPASIELPAGVAGAHTGSLETTGYERDARRSFITQLPVPISIFLLSRGFLLMLGWGAARLLPNPHIVGNASVLPRTDVLHSVGTWTGVWFRFDTSWYVGVAEHGYHWGAPGVANTNFMPVYPLLIRALQPLTLGSAYLSAWLVANISCLVAFVLLWHWLQGRFDRPTAFRALLLFAVFPSALFFFAPYAEPVFLALAIAAFMAAESDHWGWAIGAAGACTITRPVGMAVVLALIVLAIRRGETRRAALALLASVPLLAFAGYLGLEFGHPLGFLTYHSQGWAPVHGGLLTTLGAQFHTRLSPFDRVDAVLVGIFLATSTITWRRLGPEYAVYVLVGVLLPLVHGLVSMERYVIVLFPAMATWASFRSHALQAALFGACMVGTVVTVTLFCSGYTVI